MNKTYVKNLVADGILEAPMDGNHGELHPTSKDYVQSGIPFIMSSDVFNGKVNYKDCKYITEDTAKGLRKGFAKKGDVLLTHKASIGRTAVLKDIPTDYIVLTPQVTYYRILDKSKLNNYYLKYFFDSPEFQYIINKMSGAGSTRAYIGIKEQLNLPIYYPESIEEQGKIAKVLSTIDDKIELNNKINSELEAMAKELYEYWFVQFDFPDENGKPYKSSGGKMVWSDELKREIPEGWEVKKAKDICPVVTGKEDANFSTPNGEYKFFTCSQDTLRCDTPAFEGKSILIAGNGVFNVKYYNGMFNAYQRTYVLIPDDEKYVGVLYLVSKDLIDSFTKKSAGSIVKFITKGDVEGITLLDPHNDKLLNQINSIIETIAHNIEENDKLSELRDFLLPMLMNGQVTVRYIFVKKGFDNKNKMIIPIK